MHITNRLNYYRRIFPVYLGLRKSHLTFWHEEPEVNDYFEPGKLGEYYMPFFSKANYQGQYDKNGIPLLDYHGKIGLQYNPIAISQYGLGNYNLFCRTSDSGGRLKFLRVADWLVENLDQNSSGLWVWNHHFDWEYRTPLKAPWYSGLAQGQGISVLVRAYQVTQDVIYLDAARRAFGTFLKTVDQGGVIYRDGNGNVWFEEYVVFPPTHILNGFIWASWGVYDYFLAMHEAVAETLFHQAIETLKTNMEKYDAGFWSLYEQSGATLKMLASPFYHKLHIVQLKVLYRLTGQKVFNDYAEKWLGYQNSQFRRSIALAYKALFKLLYY